MARGKASACLSLALWVWCASVCFVSAKDKYQVHPETPSAVEPASLSQGGNITFPIPAQHASTVSRRQKPQQTTDADEDRHQEAAESPRGGGAQNSSGGEVPVREASSKRNTSVQGSGAIGVSAAARSSSSSSSATAEQLRSATSLAGNLALLLISVVIAGALFVMVICFIHKWKENMGTGRYPRVVYSMLRQSEDEPEDVLGEILINIGLAAPGDTRPLTPSSSSSSSRCSPTPAEPEMDINDLEGTKFTTIPLRPDEAAKRLMAPEPEESDEELLQ